MLIVLLLAGCAGESGREMPIDSPSRQQEGSDAALGFASAWLENDIPAARRLQCPGVPKLDPEVDGLRLEEPRVEGAPTPGPYLGGIVEVEDPQYDFHVLFVASEGGEPRRGAAEVELGKRDGTPYVLSYGLTMDLPAED